MTKSEKRKIKIIDLFAGIGGTRTGFYNAGKKTGREVECVYTSEYDKYAQITYFKNYGEMPDGDIREVTKDKETIKKKIPDFDIVLAGFPCQPFSIAGVSKKISMGRKHGFDDVKQGNLFFSITKIIDEKKPAAFFLENVKNLQSHDKHNTFAVIKSRLMDLGYTFDFKVIDARVVVPQHRERIYMVGFKKELVGEDYKFEFPEIKDRHTKLKDILETEVDPKYTLSDKLWDYLQKYAKKHKEKGNGFGFGMADPEGVTRTLSARYHKDGSEILIAQEGKNPRRLTPKECAKLMGFDVKKFKFVVSDTQAYRQFGNSITVPVVQEIATKIIKVLDNVI